MSRDTREQLEMMKKNRPSVDQQNQLSAVSEFETTGIICVH